MTDAKDKSIVKAVRAMGEILRLDVGIPPSIIGRVREAYDGLRAALKEAGDGREDGSGNR